MTLEEETLRFLQQTSVRGVARSAGTKQCGLRLMWTCFIVLFLVMAVYQSVGLILEYLSYPIIAVLQERRLYNTAIFKPNLVLCNLNPFSRQNIGLDITSALTKYQEEVLRMVSCDKSTQSCLDDVETRQILDAMLSPQGYYHYTGGADDPAFRHDVTDFVIFCYKRGLVGAMETTAPCNLGSVRRFSRPDYMNCYSFSDNNSPTQTVGLTLTLFLNNFPLNVTVQHMNTADNTGGTIGAKIVINQQNEFPDIESDGADLLPGHLSTVRVMFNRRTYLEAPYGTCTRPEPLHDQYYQGEPILYSSQACTAMCITKNVRRRCGCTDIDALPVDSMLQEGVPSCADLNVSRREFIWRMTCMINLKKGHARDCATSCPQACEEVNYVQSVTQSIWPNPQFNLGLYNDMIRNQTFEHLFLASLCSSRPRDLHTQTLESCIDNPADERLYALISRNFLRIKVTYPQKYVHIEDMPKLTFLAFLSQLGGALNLWSGISFIVIVEIAEFLLRVAKLTSTVSKTSTTLAPPDGKACSTVQNPAT